MLMGFQRGRFSEAYSMVSTTSRIEGSTGKMYSFWAVYSLRMSF